MGFALPGRDALATGMALIALVLCLTLVAPASALSAERSLELVTPELPGPSVTNVERISANGDAVIFQSFGPFPGAAAGDLFSYNLAVRGEGGWVDTPIDPPYEASQASLAPTKPVAFDEDLTTSLWQSSLPLTPDAPAAGRFAFYRRSPDGSVGLETALGEAEPGVIGASDDGDRLVFSYSEHLLASDASRTSGSGIYELVGSALREADVGAGGEEISTCGAETDGPASASRSGERVVFSAHVPDCGQPLRVYVREGGEQTVEASKSMCTRPDCNAPQSVFFVGTTPSASSVFMVTSQQLTNEDQDDRPDLYRRDLVSGRLELLTGDIGGEEEVLAKPVHASADGSRVYFYALGPGDRSELWLWEGTQLRVIGPLASDQPFATSPDGRYALLTTSTPLSAVTTGAPVEGTDLDDRQDVYRYDALLNRLELISAGPGAGSGPFDASSRSPLEGVRPEGGEVAFRAISDDGQRAWFTTEEGLVSEDGNDAEDLYEWHSGELHLVSDGRGQGEVAFAGASPDGRTVLFRTSRTLVPADRDGGERDVYAARIGGGFDDESRSSPECPQSPCRRSPAGGGRAALPATLRGSSAARGRLEILRISEDRVARVVRSGRTIVYVRAPFPGIVSAAAFAFHARLAGGAAGATEIGTIPVVLRWTARARAQLAAAGGGGLRFRLRVREGAAEVMRRLKLKGVSVG
jgi:hypothetical protein